MFDRFSFFDLGYVFLIVVVPCLIACFFSRKSLIPLALATLLPTLAIVLICLDINRHDPGGDVKGVALLWLLFAGPSSLAAGFLLGGMAGLLGNTLRRRSGPPS